MLRHQLFGASVACGALRHVRSCARSGGEFSIHEGCLHIRQSDKLQRLPSILEIGKFTSFVRRQSASLFVLPLLYVSFCSSVVQDKETNMLFSLLIAGNSRMYRVLVIVWHTDRCEWYAV